MDKVECLASEGDEEVDPHTQLLKWAKSAL